MQSSANPANTSRLQRLGPWAWLALPLVCHFGFSWIGFNPTDDGWMLAIARRIVDGHMPYRDFIFIFPALSVLLQIPLLLLGGDHVIWLSRLWGWVTIGAVCWIWSGRVLKPGVSFHIRYTLYVGTCLLCVHTFPVQAWHSLDGMLLISLAVVLAGRDTPGSLRAAFVCVGLAGLCRQNFAVFPPLLLLAVSNPYKWRAMIWTALPPLLYTAAILLAGCLHDFIQQVTATGGKFLQVAALLYLRTPGFLWALPASAVAAWLLRANRSLGMAGPMVFGAASAYAAIGLWCGRVAYNSYAFQLFGFTIGLTLIAVWRGLAPKDRLTMVGGLGLAWVTAISIGYSNPALMSGVLWCLLWRLICLLETPGETPRARQSPPLVLLASVVCIGIGFWHARQFYPYRDRPAATLLWEVGEVLPGGAGIRTNSLTYSTLAELRSLTVRFDSEHRRFGILTDCSAYWVRSPSGNPLVCEWPQETALGYDPELFARFFAGMRNLPAGSRLIVQKYLISDYSKTLTPVPLKKNYYFVQNWVRANCRKVEETKFFEVYLPPRER